MILNIENQTKKSLGTSLIGQGNFRQNTLVVIPDCPLQVLLKVHCFEQVILCHGTRYRFNFNVRFII